MGGTSFDICLVRDGRPEIKTDWNWRYRYYIGLPMVDVQSVGAGGGSIARVRQGALLVGPESAGSVPGPACYGRGGTRPRSPTPTPCSATSRPTGSPAAACTSTSTRARTAIERDVAEPLGVDVDRGRVGHRAHRQREHGERDPQGARRPRRRPARPRADRVRRQRRGARGAIARELGIDRILVPEGRAGVLRARRARRRLRRRPRRARTSLPCRRSTSDRVRDLMHRTARRGRQGAGADRRRRRRRRARAVRADVLPGPELRHERARARGHRARRARPARPRRAVPRPARGGARLLLPQPAAAGARRARRRPRHARRSPTTSPRAGTVADADAARQGTRPAYWGDGFVDTPGVRRRRARRRARRSTVRRWSRSRSPWSSCRPARAATLDGLGNYDVAL